MTPTALRKNFCSFLVVAVFAMGGTGVAHAQTQPQFGPIDADFAAFDKVAKDFLGKWNLPGLSVVVGYDDRIIYAQGYGYADIERQIVSSPWLEYRLGSVSKTFTAVAIARLVEAGLISVDESAWNLVSQWMGIEPKDPRVKQITIRQLLTFSWGLDRAMTPEPNGKWYMDNGKVVTTNRMLLKRYLQNNNLDFAPGARYSYNGAGYSWLQLIAELVDGRPLEEQLSAMLGVEPLSTGSVRIGTTYPGAITEAEPEYYEAQGGPKLPPVPGLYPAPAPALVAAPHGAFTLDAFGGGGGLVASPLTLMRFLQRMQGIRQPALIHPAVWGEMQREQTLADNTRYVGLGVQTIPYLSDPPGP